MDLFDLRQWPGFKAAGGDLSEPAWINQVSIDSRRIETSQSLFVALKGLQTDGHLFISHASKAGARYALVDRKYPFQEHFPELTLLKVENSLKALQEIAKAYRETLPLKLIAITGSYGKTMVKDLLQEMLRSVYSSQASPESFNSQIGVPLSIFTLSKNHEIGILEVAISEKSEMDRHEEMLKPDYGIITQVGKKHLHTLGSLSTLIEELFKLFQKGDKLQWTLLPHTPEIKPFLPNLSSRTIFWNQPISDMPHAERLSKHQELSIPFQITFPDFSCYRGHITSGFYYYLDLLNMTVKAAWLLGIPPEEICKTLDRYTLEPMRTEIWKSPLGITFLNDAYSEDPLSVDKALKFLDATAGTGRKVFLFGGLKGEHTPIDYRRVGRILSKHEVDLVCLIGSHPFEPLMQVLSTESPTTTILKADTYPKALEMFKSVMHPSDIVLIKGEKKEPLEKITENFHESLCTNLCLVNLAAIEHNIRAIRQKLPSDIRIMVMVKALAYGTDDFRIAKFLKTCGIDILGVSYVDEGVALKRGGVTQTIFVLNAASYEVNKVVKWELEVGVSSKDFIEHLAEEATKAGKQVKVHLHIDTGMSRFGCRPEEALKLAKNILSHSSLILEGVMTHFASADNPEEDPFTLEQAHKLVQVIDLLQENGIHIPWKHAANSSGALRFHFPEFNMVRIGLAVYGLYPSDATKKALELRLAISLISRIVGINYCRMGDTISYGRTYRVERTDQKIAVLPIGYFDGLHRNYSGRGHVIIRGQKAPMVGKICMDFMMVDVTDILHVAPGDPVLIFGEDEYGDYLSPEDLALKGDSIIHELITCLGPRIQRVFIYEETNAYLTER